MKDLPQFRYSPNAYKIGVFEEKKGICSVCDQPCEIRYTSSFYAVDDPEYLCPWCIANGEAAKKYKGSFVDYESIESVESGDIPEEMLLEVSERTPSYISWQQQEWRVCCNQPCAFIDYADGDTVRMYEEEFKEDTALFYDLEFLKVNLTRDQSMVGYLFRCLHCGKHKLHVDCD